MLLIFLLSLPLIVIFIISNFHSINISKIIKATMQPCILIIISTCILITPIKVILTITGISGIYIVTTIVSILMTKIFFFIVYIRIIGYLVYTVYYTLH